MVTGVGGAPCGRDSVVPAAPSVWGCGTGALRGWGQIGRVEGPL